MSYVCGDVLQYTETDQGITSVVDVSLDNVSEQGVVFNVLLDNVSKQFVCS